MSLLLDMWMAYDALSRRTGADQAAIEDLLLYGLARLEGDQKSPIPPAYVAYPPIAPRTRHAVSSAPLARISHTTMRLWCLTAAI
jgi:hypothetical protein